MVCYWGAHYISYFKNDNKDDPNTWISYDDMIVRKIPTWKELIEKSIRAHFHPTILFYRKIDNDDISYVRGGDVKNPLSEYDMKKIIAYCENYDKENEIPYKQSDNAQTRLRPSSKDKRASTTDINEKLKKSKFNLLDDSFEERTNTISSHNEINKYQNTNTEEEKVQSPNIKVMSISNNKEKEIPSKKDSDKNLPIVGEDEWICQSLICRNVNKIDDHSCLSK
jgi:hypothetical protein